jgi:hypothetical protein
MERTVRQSFSLVLTALVLTGFFGTQGWAASGSCQTKTEGKLECMEFTGNLPAYLRNLCGLGGSQNTQWVDGLCPQDNLLGFCEVPRDDGVVQRIHCYRMAELPDGQRLEYCRMSCKGAFIAMQGGSSASSGSPVAAPGSTVTPVGSKVKAAESTAATVPPQYVMEQDTNRFGEDYKDLDLDTPDPALCAEACMREAKCRAWTYVKPGVQADNAKCWLKNKVPPPSPDDNCVSGVNKRKK